MRKKWSFPLRISLVNVPKSTRNCGFGHIYWRNPWRKTLFFVQWRLWYFRYSTHIHDFFLSNTFISNNNRVKLAKNKQKLSNTTMRLNFRYLKIIRFLYPRYYLKLNEDILKNVQKTSSPVLMTLNLV